MLDQQVYVVDFDDTGVVSGRPQDLEGRRRTITPVARATPAPGRELTFLEQLIGNLGKFNGGGGRRRRAAAAAASPGPSPVDENR